MTVSTSDSRVVYDGNGSTQVFSTTFEFLDEGDLEVTLIASDGSETTQTITTDYTVTGGDGSTGSVTMLSAPASGEQLVIERIMDLVQGTDLVTQGVIPAETLEQDLDELTYICQQLQDKLDRAIKLDKATSLSPSATELPPLVADRAVVVNSAGDALVLAEFSDISESLDTNITSPADDDILQFGSGSWRNESAPNLSAGTVVPTGGAVARSLADRFGRDTDLTVNVPSDYATLQEAVDDLAGLVMVGGAKAIVNIESGHTPASGVVVENGDFGHIWIQSADAEVTIDATFPTGTSIIKGVNARMPVLNTIFDANSQTVDHGYHVFNNSAGKVESGAGVKNVAGSEKAGLMVVAASSCHAQGSVFTGNERNVRCTSASQLEIPDATLTGAGEFALFVSRGSICQCTNSDLSNAGDDALRVQESFVAARNVTLDGATGEGCSARRGALVDLRDQGGNTTSIANVGGAGVEARSGSYVQLADGTVDNAGGIGVTAIDLARVHAVSATITNNTSFGVSVERGGVVDVRAATVTGNGTNDLRVANGGHIYAQDTTTSTSGSSGNSPDAADTNLNAFNHLTPAGFVSSGTGGTFENDGSATIPSGSTSVAVTHGLTGTPDRQDINLVPTNSGTNSPGHVWISAAGATTFTVNCENDPGSGGLTFNWKAAIR